MALKQNPDVRFAATHRSTTEMQLLQQKARYYPVVEIAGGIGYEKSRNPTASALNSAGDGITLTRKESSLSLVQNLFAGFSTVNEVDRLTQTVNAAAHNVNGTAQDTALLVVEKYLEILRHQQFVAEAKANLAAHQRVSGMIGDRSESGVSKGADLDQAHGRLALARANVIAEEAGLADAETAYMRVVGSYPKKLFRPLPPTEGYLPKSEKQAVLIALENNPILKSANSDISAAKAQHKTSKHTNLPRIDAVLSGSRNANLDGQPGPNDDQLAMVRGTWNLFNGGADVSRQRETAYQVQEASEVRNRTVLQIRESMGFSWNAWKSSAKRLIPLGEHRRAAKATLDAYGEEFKLGDRTLLDLLDAQNEYYQSRLNYITGEFTEMYAKYRIFNVMGTLLQCLNIPLPPESIPKTADNNKYTYGEIGL
jgi:adhesin transport system outer membrane protein